MQNTYKSFIISILLVMCTLFSTAQPDKDKAAIRAAIEKETTAFFQADYKGWIESWVHAPYAYWSLSDTSGFNTFEGWKAIEIGFTDYFLTSKPSTAKIERKWGDIRIYGSGAFARFVQLTTEDGATTVQDEFRVLEKLNNQWKIVVVGVMKQKGKLAP